MLRLSVAQKPIMPVSAGTKNERNFPSFGCPAENALGVANIGPKPPAAE